MRLEYKEKQTSKDEMLGLIEEIKQSRKILTGIAIWALGKSSMRLSRDTYHKYKLRSDLNVVWLEHWPPGTDPIMGPPDDYLLVRENYAGNPIHLRIDAKEFIELLKYDPNVIMKPREIFENASFKEKA